MKFPEKALREIQKERTNLFTAGIGIRPDIYEPCGLMGIATRMLDVAVDAIETVKREDVVREQFSAIASLADVGVLLYRGKWHPLTASEMMAVVQNERIEVGVKKNADYSSAIDNISICGLYGLVTRIFDKASRIVSLARRNDVYGKVGESIEDTLLDAGNYADYALAFLQDDWNPDYGAVPDLEECGKLAQEPRIHHSDNIQQFRVTSDHDSSHPVEGPTLEQVIGNANEEEEEKSELEKELEEPPPMPETERRKFYPTNEERKQDEGKQAEDLYSEDEEEKKTEPNTGPGCCGG